MNAFAVADPKAVGQEYEADNVDSHRHKVTTNDAAYCPFGGWIDQLRDEFDQHSAFSVQ